jgi:hypothetical protein
VVHFSNEGRRQIRVVPVTSVVGHDLEEGVAEPNQDPELHHRGLPLHIPAIIHFTGSDG